MMFKSGVIAGVIENLNFIEIAIFTFLGSMTTVSVVTFLGNRYRKQLAHFLKEVRILFFKIEFFFLNLFKRSRELSIEELRGHVKALAAPKKFSKTTRIAVKAWHRFGLWGIAILTPIILSATGGALIAVSFRVRTRKVVSYMAIVHAICALLFSYFFVEFKDFVQEITGINLRHK
jgi:hypothetical protein